jgi:hypothetical protein
VGTMRSLVPPAVALISDAPASAHGQSVKLTVSGGAGAAAPTSSASDEDMLGHDDSSDSDSSDYGSSGSGTSSGSESNSDGAASGELSSPGLTRQWDEEAEQGSSPSPSPRTELGHALAFREGSFAGRARPDSLDAAVAKAGLIVESDGWGTADDDGGWGALPNVDQGGGGWTTSWALRKPEVKVRRRKAKRPPNHVAARGLLPPQDRRRRRPLAREQREPKQQRPQSSPSGVPAGGADAGAGAGDLPAARPGTSSQAGRRRNSSPTPLSGVRPQSAAAPKQWNGVVSPSKRAPVAVGHCDHHLLARAATDAADAEMQPEIRQRVSTAEQELDLIETELGIAQQEQQPPPPPHEWSEPAAESAQGEALLPPPPPPALLLVPHRAAAPPSASSAEAQRQWLQQLGRQRAQIAQRKQCGQPSVWHRPTPQRKPLSASEVSAHSFAAVASSFSAFTTGSSSGTDERPYSRLPAATRSTPSIGEGVHQPVPHDRAPSVVAAAHTTALASALWPARTLLREKQQAGLLLLPRADSSGGGGGGRGGAPSSLSRRAAALAASTAQAQLLQAAAAGGGGLLFSNGRHTLNRKQRAASAAAIANTTATNSIAQASGAEGRRPSSAGTVAAAARLVHRVERRSLSQQARPLSQRALAAAAAATTARQVPLGSRASAALQSRHNQAYYNTDAARRTQSHSGGGAAATAQQRRPGPIAAALGVASSKAANLRKNLAEIEQRMKSLEHVRLSQLTKMKHVRSRRTG